MFVWCNYCSTTDAICDSLVGITFMDGATSTAQVAGLTATSTRPKREFPDYILLAANFEGTMEQVATVPEPPGAMLAIATGLIMLVARIV